MLSRLFSESDEQLSINFGYQCVSKNAISYKVAEEVSLEDSGNRKFKRNSSFTCLSGAALSANFTLANTTICNGLIGEGILPALDSPNKFQSVISSPSLSSLNVLSSSLQGSTSNIIGSAYSHTDSGNRKFKRNSSFSCLSGSALSANFTLANTAVGNGLIGDGILPALDSPNQFQSVISSSSLSSLDVSSSSLQGSISNITGYASPQTQSDCSEFDTTMVKVVSAPSKSEGFLNAPEVKIAGGAAGEDRVQAVCSEENGWLFCGIYDGFNGRDAADFLAGTLYENIKFYLNTLDSRMNRGFLISLDQSFPDLPFQCDMEDSLLERSCLEYNMSNGTQSRPIKSTGIAVDSFRHRVLDSLQQALAQAENDFLHMVEQEMDERPDLVSIGSCVLVVLLFGQDLYTLSLGDSRAILASQKGAQINETGDLEALQLTDLHSVDNEEERLQLLSKHPDDPKTIVAGRVKGKLKLTRAFGVGYLKKKELNDALMGILRVQNLLSPPYISTEPSLHVHRVSKGDHFVILASDGMFDLFSSEEAVKLVDSFIMRNPFGSPAKFLVEQLVAKAAQRAGLTVDELLGVPAGRRRKYHDDVSVIVILLGSDQRTSSASTFL